MKKKKNFWQFFVLLVVVMGLSVGVALVSGKSPLFYKSSAYTRPTNCKACSTKSCRSGFEEICSPLGKGWEGCYDLCATLGKVRDWPDDNKYYQVCEKFGGTVSDLNQCDGLYAWSYAKPKSSPPPNDYCASTWEGCTVEPCCSTNDKCEVPSRIGEKQCVPKGMSCATTGDECTTSNERPCCVGLGECVKGRCVRSTPKPSSTSTPKPTSAPTSTPRPTSTPGVCAQSCVARIECTENGGTVISGSCTGGRVCCDF